MFLTCTILFSSALRLWMVSEITLQVYVQSVNFLSETIIFQAESLTLEHEDPSP